jgi:hypothetical protein
MKYKEYTKKEVEKFCEDNFIEESTWLWNFVKGTERCNIQMVKNTLVVKIQGDATQEEE